VAPIVLVIAVVVLSAVHAPPVAYLVALGASYAFLFFGRVGSRRARASAGAVPSIGVRRTLREGGLWIVLLVPVAALVVLLIALAR
jgi:hypothetical protein